MYACTLTHQFRAAEPEDLPSSAAGCLLHPRIIRIQNEEVFRALPGEHPLLRGRVIFEISVAIEMVRSEVQQHRDPGMEGIHRFQLEAGKLEHAPRARLIFRHVHQFDCRQPDVAAYERRQSTGLQDLPGECGRRGLAVRAGDGKDLGLQEAGG